MTCGHYTCYSCMQNLVATPSALFPCPLCRTTVPIASISYVHGGGSSDLNLSNVVGNYSIKILAITAKVLSVIQNEPDAKILVFSTVSVEHNISHDSRPERK